MVKSLALSPTESRREITVDTGLLRMSILPAAKCPRAADQRGHLVKPSATLHTHITSCGAALQANGWAASPLNPAQTIIKLVDALQWETQPSFPHGSADICPLIGDSTVPGFYYVLIRWHPGYMSAPILIRAIGFALGQQRRLFRSRFVRACACRQLCVPRGWNSALRRSDPRPK